MYVQINSWISNVLYGGEFLGSVTRPEIPNVQQKATDSSVAFWCVDDQEVFLFGDHSYADIIKLSDVAANPSYVRYGDVTNSPNSPATNVWTNQGTVGGQLANALPSDAASRYKMAAWLVSQYAGFDQYIATTGADGAKDEAIQKAIWTITNTQENTPNIYDSGTNAIGDPTVQYWINDAIQNYSSVNTAHWAVVSWGASQEGALYTGRYDSGTPGRQTFLVELDGTNALLLPEPGFYAVLAMGFTGLIVISRRRKRAA
jgi:hypothetical protein